MSTFTEENYLKEIYSLWRRERDSVSTTLLAEMLNTKASSVTDMMKKLSAKKLVNYEKYQGVTLTENGKAIAINVIRKHRLWEVFLVEKLNFKWDEVHVLAEQLEHIDSEMLIERLEKFLGYPKFDPHGDPIPDKNGNIIHHKDLALSDILPGEKGVIIGVKEHSAEFLRYLEGNKLLLGTNFKVVNVFEFDQSMIIKVKSSEITLSNQVSKNLYVTRSNE